MWFRIILISTPDIIGMNMERQAVDFQFNFSQAKARRGMVVSYFCLDIGKSGQNRNSSPGKVNPSHAAIKISINATAAEFICKNIFPIPVQIKKIIKNKTGDIQQIYLYQNVCK